MTRIFVIGECMIEIAQSDREFCQFAYGGDCYNTALYLTRLGYRATFLTALGTDPFSCQMRNQWMDEGLDTAHVLTEPHRLPGLYLIKTDTAGERDFFYWREHAAVRSLFQLDGIKEALTAAKSSDLLYLSGITLSLFTEHERRIIVDLARDVRKGGGHVAFDPNYRSKGWRDVKSARAAIDAIAPFVSIVLPTYDDERALRGDAEPHDSARWWQAHGASEVVVKIGAAGCLVVDDKETVIVAPSEQVIPVDTTGAGDSFNAGYLAGRLAGQSSRAAAAFANLLAGKVVGYHGAIIPAEAMLTLPVQAQPNGKP